MQGAGWGENGFFRTGDDLLLTGDLFATTMPATAPCSSKASCAQGYYDADCSCVCRENWAAATAGGPCTICRDHCSTGVLNKDDCSCACAAGYLGNSCDDYLLGRWLTVDLTKKQATIQFAWDMSADRWKGESKVQRYAALPASGNPQISGTSVKMTDRKGTLTVALDLTSTIDGYPANQYAYAVALSLGTNEFGVSKGFTRIDIPLFQYNAAKNCVQGGHLIDPTAAIASSTALCAGMVAVAATAAPVATSLPTLAPTAVVVTPTPTEIPTLSPATKPTETPSFVPSYNPSLAPTTPPTESPTVPPSLIPTLAPTQGTPGPSKDPTIVPTVPPTPHPSLNPSLPPTPTPTVVPTTPLSKAAKAYETGLSDTDSDPKDLAALAIESVREVSVEDRRPIIPGAFGPVVDAAAGQ